MRGTGLTLLVLSTNTALERLSIGNTALAYLDLSNTKVTSLALEGSYVGLSHIAVSGTFVSLSDAFPGIDPKVSEVQGSFL